MPHVSNIMPISHASYMNEIPDIINIMPISGNAHVGLWTYYASLLLTVVVVTMRVTFANRVTADP